MARVREKKSLPCGEKVPVQHAGQPLVIWQGNEAIQCFRCSDCGHLFFDPPAPEVLNDYYQNVYPQSAASWYNLKNDWNEGRCTYRVAHLRDIANRWLGTDKVYYHESGCSFGGTVQKFNQLGLKATGTELNQAAVAEARAKGNTAIHDKTDKEFFAGVSAAKRPDFVYSFHCLEHMPDPKGYLRDLRNVLSSKSMVLINVPNGLAASSLLRGFRKNSWFAYPDHLNLFSASSVSCLAEATGYQVLDVWTNLLADSEPATEELLAAKSDSVRGRVMSQMIQDSLMGLELCFLLTPKGSTTAKKHRPAIARAKEKMLQNRARELQYLELQSHSAGEVRKG